MVKGPGSPEGRGRVLQFGRRPIGSIARWKRSCSAQSREYLWYAVLCPVAFLRIRRQALQAGRRYGGRSERCFVRRPDVDVAERSGVLVRRQWRYRDLHREGDSEGFVAAVSIEIAEIGQWRAGQPR